MDLHKTHLRKDKATVMAEHHILVLPGMRLPHGWNISLGSLAIPLVSENERK